MLKLRTVAGIAALSTVALAPPAGAAITISNVRLFQDAAHTAVCGIEIHPANQPATELLCSGPGVPRPKNGGPVGDPFVQIGQHGRPQLVLISQDSYVGKILHTPAPGTLWHRIGVTCSIGTSTILCFNADNHGFVIGGSRFRSF